uniref:NADH-ubiquinone oxidoreductase chain 6 n=1 Tax=Lepidophyma flavimaculatum TaxID=264485 RepID=A1IGI0_9SAUR|nr:NADH dehydrogenase subunit 6 [Lepidophyma flavimaculatum]BAF43990.1 NADH dehydrogenase subunit 6 [Lepidophyma flavimaculatum]
MTYLVLLLSVCIILGQLTVAANPSPYFGVIGLVLSAVFGSGMMALIGNSFVSLALFLIYLGGMLVVFAYSMALSSDPFPETIGAWSASLYFLVFCSAVVFFGFMFVESVSLDGLGLFGVDGCGVVTIRMDLCGVSLFYSVGGWCLLISGGGLLLALFVVLELTRGLGRGGLRAV